MRTVEPCCYVMVFGCQRGSLIKAANSLTARTKYPRDNNCTLTGGSSYAYLVNMPRLMVHRTRRLTPGLL